MFINAVKVLYINIVITLAYIVNYDQLLHPLTSFHTETTEAVCPACTSLLSHEANSPRQP